MQKIRGINEKDEVSFHKWCADRFNHFPITPEELNAQYAANDDSDNYYVMSAFDETGVVEQLTMRFTDEEKKSLRCYEAVGLVKKTPESSWNCEILGESWKCIELVRYPDSAER